MSASVAQFGAVFEPAEAAEPILSRPLRGVFMDWLTELWAVSELAEVGIKPRQRAIFAGPPGTGKTTLAHHLSARLGMRMLLVGPEKINCRYISASAEAVGKLFDAVERQEEPLVLFFDEFDSVAAQRMGSGVNEAAEQDHNLMINTLLSRLDRFDGIVIAACNFPERIDAAIWRRFNLHVTLDRPGQRERERIVERYFVPFILSDAELARFGEAFEGASPALMREFCEAVKRHLVIAPIAGWPQDRASMIERILTYLQPAPADGKPRLWAHGAKDAAIANLQWPLSKEARAVVTEPVAESATVVPLRGAR